MPRGLSTSLSIVQVKNVLTRTSGYLKTITSHSLQPYRGCTLGRSLCGVGCYVQHNGHITRGREWGSFLEVRENAAGSYLETVQRERRWARRSRDGFTIFLSSSTEPFLPQERRHRVTRRVLEAMIREPPDGLVLQTHSHRVTDELELVGELAGRCDLRLHVSIETDRERLAGLPPHASSVAKRLAAARSFRAIGVRTVVTVSPILPIADPDAFFAAIAACADAVVLDHFVGGDGSEDGTRTRRTPLPAAMEALRPGSTSIHYRDELARVAERHLPGRVGVHIDGFAGRFLFS